MIVVWYLLVLMVLYFSAEHHHSCASHRSCCFRTLATMLESLYSSKSSWLYTYTGPKIRRSALRSKTPNRFLSDSDNVHDSAPYIRTDMMSVLKMLSLVLLRMNLDFSTLERPNSVRLASTILLLISRVMLFCVLTELPRYVNSSTDSNCSMPIVMHFCWPSCT